MGPAAMTAPDRLLSRLSNVRETCHGMPNQFDGLIDGKPFYFRARHGSWDLSVEGRVVADGEDPEAGWWHGDDAWEALYRAVQAYCEATDE